MKHFQNQVAKILSATIVMICLATFSFAQGNGKYNFDVTDLLDKILLNPEYKKEWEVIKQMRLEGANDVKILDFIEENYAKPRRKAALGKRVNNGDVLHPYSKDKNMHLLSGCSGGDVGVDNGTFSAWQGQTSCMSTSCTGCTSLTWSNATLPLAGRITIVPAPTTEPCASVAGFPIPLPSPSGGPFSVKLGNNQVNAETERISHQFIVQPSDTNFIYQYAVVFEDPAHSPSDQPFFDFMILAQNGDTVPCSYQHYTAGAGIPGFQNSPGATGCTGTPKYKPWTTVGVNLGAYVGQMVTVICTTGDCALCGHYGMAYLDFTCGTTSATQFCVGTNSVVVVAPLEPGATYSWTTTPPQTTQSVTVNPQVVDTISVFVNPPSGCGYFVNYILQPTVINPAFTYTTGCTTANFTNATTITGGTISSYLWSFPGGSPSSSTSQTPPTITYPPGATYTVTLSVTSQAGCTAASVPMTVTIAPPPVVNAGTDVTVCGGNTAVLNGSGTPAGGTYSWTPTTNLSSATIANPTTGPVTVPATYTLTYTNTSGCKNTDVVNLLIGAEPVALANYSLTLTCDGVSAQFADAGSQNATAWFWNFGDGATSQLQNPGPHIFPYNGTYNVTLVVTNAACDDTLLMPVTVGDINQFITVTPANVFTPNGDNLNDCFKPIISGPAVAELEKCMTMRIYDRWGIEIFESTGGSNVCWDGKTKSNTKAKAGTYYYLIEIGGNTYKGYLTLVREKK